MLDVKPNNMISVKNAAKKTIMNVPINRGKSVQVTKKWK
jgi:hypothetical protein